MTIEKVLVVTAFPSPRAIAGVPPNATMLSWPSDGLNPERPDPFEDVDACIVAMRTPPILRFSREICWIGDFDAWRWFLHRLLPMARIGALSPDCTIALWRYSPDMDDDPSFHPRFIERLLHDLKNQTEATAGLLRASARWLAQLPGYEVFRLFEDALVLRWANLPPARRQEVVVGTFLEAQTHVAKLPSTQSVFALACSLAYELASDGKTPSDR